MILPIASTVDLQEQRWWEDWALPHSSLNHKLLRIYHQPWCTRDSLIHIITSCARMRSRGRVFGLSVCLSVCLSTTYYQPWYTLLISNFWQSLPLMPTSSNLSNITEYSPLSMAFWRSQLPPLMYFAMTCVEKMSSIYTCNCFLINCLVAMRDACF